MPASMPALSAAQLLYLRARQTAYTEDFADIFPHLSPDAIRSALPTPTPTTPTPIPTPIPPRVKRVTCTCTAMHFHRSYLRDFTEMPSARLRVLVYNDDPSRLTLRNIIDGVFGRPATIPRGPTPLDILPPLLDCDTKSYQDLLKIFANCVRLAMCALFIVLFGDGQTVLRARDLKRKFPNQHRCVGRVHFSVRRVFISHTLTRTCATQGSRDRLRPFPRFCPLVVYNERGLLGCFALLLCQGVGPQEGGGGWGWSGQGK